MTVLELPSGLRLSVAEPAGPVRCTIYALHGGGLSAAYWDCPSDPSLSLVRLATSAGCRVAYLDRPGHGSNEAAWPGGLPAADEAALHASAINGCWPGEPVFLLAQSAGSMVALRIASAGLVPGLIGVEYSGVGIALDISRIEGGLSLESFWGPLHLYPPATFSAETRVTTPTTPHDGNAAQTWGDVFHQVAGSVRVPVRITMVDTEAWWGDVPTTLTAIAAGFTNCDSVETNVEFASGHNVSVGLSARAYHLGVLAFAERCLRRAALIEA